MATSKQKRMVAVAAGGLVLLVGGVALAASGKKKAPAEPEVDGIDLDNLPEPGTPPAVIIDTRDSDAEEVGPPFVPPTVSPPITNHGVTTPSPVTLPPIPGVTVPEVVVPDLAELPELPDEIDLSELPLPGEKAPSPEPVLAAADPLSVKLLGDLKAAEKVAGWKRVYPVVKEWQAFHGRTVDGKFGPKDAVYLAGITGDIPVVRYWPLEAGRNPRAAIDDLHAALRMIAQAKPFLAAGIQRSIARERGQSFGPPQGDGGKAPIV